MRGIEIMLSSIEDVKHFVQTITMFDGEFELVSGKYIVDANILKISDDEITFVTGKDAVEGILKYKNEL